MGNTVVVSKTSYYVASKAAMESSSKTHNGVYQEEAELFSVASEAMECYYDKYHSLTSTGNKKGLFGIINGKQRIHDCPLKDATVFGRTQDEITDSNGRTLIRTIIRREY